MSNKDLVFTKTPPTEEGWYWKKEAFTWVCRNPDIVYVRRVGKKFFIHDWEIPEDVLWCGPLTEPTEP